ncbi:hypothetical protein GGI21_005322 [Coemansia aciculifera]|nr:hypothetical protein GGI21_005322 [Coemansia aciculifera]
MSRVANAGNATNSGQKNDVLPATMFCGHACESGIKSLSTTVTRAADVLSKLSHGWDLADDENDAEALVTVDDDEVPCSVATTAAKTSKFEGIAETLNRHRESSDDAEATDSLAIDWVWSTIRPLELGCAPASRFSLESGNDAGAKAEHADTPASTQIQLDNSTDEVFGEALNQRLVVGRLLADVTKMFLRDLVAAADQAMRKNQAACDSGNGEAEAKRRLLMLTPLHVLAAARQDPETFDVCSNAYLADRP